MNILVDLRSYRKGKYVTYIDQVDAYDVSLCGCCGAGLTVNGNDLVGNAEYGSHMWGIAVCFDGSLQAADDTEELFTIQDGDTPITVVVKTAWNDGEYGKREEEDDDDF